MTRCNHRLGHEQILYRGVEQSGQLGWLITIRSQVRILPPQPRKNSEPRVQNFFLVGLKVIYWREPHYLFINEFGMINL
jgi:ribosomal protein S30